jgi:hypothetical protein
MFDLFDDPVNTSWLDEAIADARGISDEQPAQA